MVLVLMPVLGLLIPLVAFSHSYVAALAGSVLWGASMGMQEAILRAAVADFTPPGGRGFAYGIFNTIYGGAWFAGSVITGYSIPLMSCMLPVSCSSCSVLRCRCCFQLSANNAGTGPGPGRCNTPVSSRFVFRTDSGGPIRHFFQYTSTNNISTVLIPWQHTILFLYLGYIIGVKERLLMDESGQSFSCGCVHEPEKPLAPRPWPDVLCLLHHHSGSLALGNPLGSRPHRTPGHGRLHETGSVRNQRGDRPPSSSRHRTGHGGTTWTQYAVSHNPEFVETNADLISLATLKANLFVIFDENGNLLYGQVLSHDFTANQSVSDDLVTLIRSNPGMVSHTADDPGLSGILLLPEGPMIVSSVPIMKADKTGAVHGTVIIGRYLEPGPLRRIDDMTGYHLTFDWQGREVSGTTVPVTQEILPDKRHLLLFRRTRPRSPVTVRSATSPERI